MDYSHTQKGKLHHIGNVCVVLLIWASWTTNPAPLELGFVVLVAAMLMLMVLSFAEMTVRDEGERLAIRYGPVPLFRRTIPYDEIEEVRVTRSAWIDGMGIHFVPWRGWTYNLWGYDCVEVHLRGAVHPVRIGSDEAQALSRFLQQRIEGTRS